MKQSSSAVLPGIDLNHLRALQILLEEAHVTKAAARLNITPPAASNALRRLRELFGDALLVRSGRSMVRTPLGETLRSPASDFTRAAEALLCAKSVEFQPASWSGAFTLLTSDSVYLTFASPLERAIGESIPGLDLTIRGPDLARWRSQGGDGLAIAPFKLNEGDLRQELLFEDRLIPTLREGHPLAAKRLTLRRYVDAKHVLVSPGGRGGSLVSDRLERLGHSRRIARVVSNHLLAAQIVAESDFITMLPARLLAAIGERFGLRSKKPPSELGAFEFAFQMTWHLRNDNSPIHRFMRTLLKQVASKKSESGAQTGGTPEPLIQVAGARV